MSRFSVVQAGDDDEFSRSLTPRQKRRELDREKAEVDGALEVWLKILDAINTGTQRKANGIALTDAILERTAQMGPIHAVHIAELAGSYSVLMRIADARFGNDLQG
jgi:hypothetical protein